MKKVIIFIIKASISIIVLLFFISKIDFIKFKEVFDGININIIFLFIAIAITQIGIYSFTQKVFLKNIGLRINYMHLFLENTVASFYGFITPGMIGKDTYFTYSYGKKISSYSKALSGILFLKIISFLSIIILVISSFIYVGNSIILKFGIKDNLDINKIIIGLLILIIFLIFSYIIAKNKLLKYYQKLKLDFVELFKITLKRKKVLLTVVILLLSFYSFSIGSRLILANLISVDISAIKLGAIILIVNFILMIPVSVSGIGVREGGFIGLLSLYGIPPEKAFLLSFFDLSISLIAALIGGSILFYRIINRKINE